MHMRFGLHAAPPQASEIKRARKQEIRKLLLAVLALAAASGMGALAYGAMSTGLGADMPYAAEGTTIAGLMIAGWIVRDVAKAMFGIMQLSDAHPVSARAYCVCANEESVQQYCIRVMQQERPLTVGESDMLRARCATPEEQGRLAAYFDEHAPMTNYGRCG